MSSSLPSGMSAGTDSGPAAAPAPPPTPPCLLSGAPPSASPRCLRRLAPLRRRLRLRRRSIRGRLRAPAVAGFAAAAALAAFAFFACAPPSSPRRAAPPAPCGFRTFLRDVGLRRAHGGIEGAECLVEPPADLGAAVAATARARPVAGPRPRPVRRLAPPGAAGLRSVAARRSARRLPGRPAAAGFSPAPPVGPPGRPASRRRQPPPGCRRIRLAERRAWHARRARHATGQLREAPGAPADAACGVPPPLGVAVVVELPPAIRHPSVLMHGLPVACRPAVAPPVGAAGPGSRPSDHRRRQQPSSPGIGMGASRRPDRLVKSEVPNPSRRPRRRRKTTAAGGTAAATEPPPPDEPPPPADPPPPEEPPPPDEPPPPEDPAAGRSAAARRTATATVGRRRPPSRSRPNSALRASSGSCSRRERRGPRRRRWHAGCGWISSQASPPDAFGTAVRDVRILETLPRAMVHPPAAGSGLRSPRGSPGCPRP